MHVALENETDTLGAHEIARDRAGKPLAKRPVKALPSGPR